MGTEEEGCLAWEPDCSFASLFRFAPSVVVRLENGVFQDNR